MSAAKPLRTKFTAIERTAIGELVSFALFLMSSKNTMGKEFGAVAAERAAKIVRGTASINTWSNAEIVNFCKIWDVGAPTSWSGSEAPAVPQHVIRVPLHAGQCRWCSCTHERPCAGSCGWANRDQTLCTACVNFDRLMRSARGRAELLEQLQDADVL